MRTDLPFLARRWGLDMATEGEALVVPCGHIVTWPDDRLAFYNTGDVDPRIFDGLGKVEYSTRFGITVSFEASRLGQLLGRLEREYRS